MAPTSEPVLTGECPPLVTACGRRIVVGELHISGPEHRVGRVTLRIGPERDGVSATWSGLSAGEARELARLLLSRAQLVEDGGKAA